MLKKGFSFFNVAGMIHIQNLAEWICFEFQALLHQLPLEVAHPRLAFSDAFVNDRKTLLVQRINAA